MAELLTEIHPGEILLEDFMKPMGITARQLATDTDVPPSRISELVNGKRPITADTAWRLGLFFDMDPRFWMNLQTEYDMRMTSRTVREKIKPRIRVFKRVITAPLVTTVPRYIVVERKRTEKSSVGPKVVISKRIQPVSKTKLM